MAVPVLVRLDGTNASEAMEILRGSKLTNVKVAADLNEAGEIIKNLVE